MSMYNPPIDTSPTSDNLHLKTFTNKHLLETPRCLPLCTLCKVVAANECKKACSFPAWHASGAGYTSGYTTPPVSDYYYAERRTSTTTTNTVPTGYDAMGNPIYGQASSQYAPTGRVL
jgi:hypothetical protein